MRYLIRRVLVSLDQQSKNERLWEQPFQALRIDADCTETGWAEFGYFLYYFKMVAPRAWSLVFFYHCSRGTKTLGTRLVNGLKERSITDCAPGQHTELLLSSCKIQNLAGVFW